MLKSTLFHNFKYSDLNTIVLSLLLLFPVLTVNQNNYFIAFVTLVSILGFIFTTKEKPYKDIGKKLLLSISLIALVISLLYTNNKAEGFLELEKRAALIVFPLIFLLRNKPISVKNRDLFEHLFILIVLVFFTWVNIKLFLKFNDIINSGTIVANWRDAITNEYFSHYYRDYFIRISRIHPTYASIYTLFSSGILILNLLNGKYSNRLIMKYTVLIIISILLVYSLFLSAKGPLIAFVVSLLFVLFFKLKRLHFFVGSIAFVLLFTIITLLFPPLKSRVFEVFKKNSSEQINSVSIRKIIHKTSWQLIKENNLFGVGIGDVQNTLDENYKAYNEQKVTSSKLNTHNEYFNLWLSAGVLGLISLLATIILPLSESIKKRNHNYIFFITFMVICFAFENILSRQKGVLFFAFFYLVYYHYQLDNIKCQQDIRKI